MFSDKIRNALKEYVGFIVIFITAALYILTAVVRIDSTGKSIPQIIADGSIIFFLGIFFNRLFSVQGIKKGESDPRMLAVKQMHTDAVLRISPYIDELDAWCDAANAANLAMERTKILAQAGLRYDDIFDKNGVSLPFVISVTKKAPRAKKRADRAKKRALRRAKGLKLAVITASILTSEGGKGNDRYYLGRTRDQYDRGELFKDVVSKLGVAIIGGYYGISIIEDFSYSLFLWNSLQIMIIIIMGVVKMYDSYYYVVEEYRNRVIKKVDLLQKFENSRKDGGINEQIRSNEPT